MTRTKRHHRPKFDPGWTYGSPMFAFGIALAWLFASAAPKSIPSNQSPMYSYSIVVAPILFLCVLSAIDFGRLLIERRRLRCREVTRRLCDCKQERITCLGDEVEVVRLADTIPLVPAQISTSLAAPEFVVRLALFLSLLGWAFHLYLNVPAWIFFGLLWATAISGAIWWVFFRTTIRVCSGRIEIMRDGLLRKRSIVLASADLTSALIECDFPKGILSIKSPNADEFRIPLDLVVRRHRLVAVIFRAAGAQS